VGLLDHPNAWHRETANRLIYERQDRSIVPSLSLVQTLCMEPVGRLHALWCLHGLGALTDEAISLALDDVATICEHAIVLAEPRLAQSEMLRRKVIALAGNPAKRVRFQVAFSLGEVAEHEPAAVRALASIARRDADDVWMRMAVLSSATHVGVPLFEQIATDETSVTNGGAWMILRDLAKVVGASSDRHSAPLLLDRLAATRLASRAPDVVDVVLLALNEGRGRGGQQILRETDGSLHARELMNSVLRRAEASARDPQANVSRRERAVALLREASLENARRVLEPLLAPNQPQRIQLAAVQTLTTFDEPDIAVLLLARWPALSPAVRSEVIARMSMRPRWTVALLDAIAAGSVPTTVIPASRKAFLMADRDPAVQSRAHAIFGEPTAPPRNEVYATYRRALDSPTDSARGEKVFERECIGCHKLGARGHAVGPNLASVQRRTPDELLLHVLNPNREVSPEYFEYTVSLDDGRILSGLITSETATSLTLVRAEGAEETILRSHVEAISSTGKSLMPEGLDTRIQPQEMADLIAFLLVLPQ
jgi:putative heme-binding domain-containing protein